MKQCFKDVVGVVPNLKKSDAIKGSGKVVNLKDVEMDVVAELDSYSYYLQRNGQWEQAWGFGGWD